MAAERSRWDLVMPVAVAVLVGMWLVSGWMLLTDYRPTMSGAGLFETDRPAPVGWFRVLAGALSGTGIALAIRARGRRSARVAAIVGAVAAGLAALVSPLAMWDQVALDGVAVGAGVRGLWWPVANSDQVRFLLLEGAEVGVGTYQRWLFVSIVAVVVASVSLLASAWPSPPDREPGRVSEPVSAGE